MKAQRKFQQLAILALLAATLISATGATFTPASDFNPAALQTNDVNLAAGKPATQSSVYSNAKASRALDGNTDGNFSSGSVTHTKADVQAWWQVDLGKSTPISTIDLWPRTDCCEWRSSNLYVLVSDKPFKSNKLSAARSQSGVSSYFISGNLAKPSMVTINRSARYVRVQLSGKDNLSLAEVVVKGISQQATPTTVPTQVPTQAPTQVPTATMLPEQPVQPATAEPTQASTSVPSEAPLSSSGQSSNVALGRPATQSSTYNGAAASRAVDGNSDGNFANGSVTHTNADAQAWWQVDLGKSMLLSDIKVHARTDCCEWRSANAYVLVSDKPFKSTRLNTVRSQAGVSSYAISGNLGSPSVVTVNRTGRYIRVQLSGTNNLSLAEVEVMNYAPVPTRPTIPAQELTATPTAMPTLTPAVLPTQAPTQAPTQVPTSQPTALPTSLPTQAPTQVPTATLQSPTTAPDQPLLTNVALGKLAIQSSVYNGGVALKAVDGNTDGNFANGSVTHTNADAQAWWQVDLGGIYPVKLINLWARTDCCQTRSKDVYILVSKSPILSGNLNQARSQAGVVSYFVSGNVGRPSMVSVNADGQYVRVQLSGTDNLSLTEVEVFSTSSEPVMLPATPIPTLAPVVIPTATQVPTAVPTQQPTTAPTAAPTFEPPANPGMDPAFQPTAQPTQPVDDSSVVRIAWFYSIPYDEDRDTVASHFNAYYMANDGYEFIDQVRSKGNQTPMVGYLVFNAIFDMGSCTAEPRTSTAAYVAGDYCTISKDHPDWFMRDTSGNLIREDYGGGKWLVYMDPANQGWRDFWLERAIRAIDERGWNGTFMDNMDGGLDRFRRMKQIPANYPDDNSLENAYADFAGYVYNAYYRPNGKRLIANVTEQEWSNFGWMRYLDNLDGMMDEGWAVDWSNGYLSRGTWETQLNYAETFQNNGKEMVFVSQGDASNLQRETFAFASYLLVANGLSSFRYTHYNAYDEPWWFDNYDARLGSPLGARYQDGANWVRDFANGNVTVNPDSHEAVIQINQ